MRKVLSLLSALIGLMSLIGITAHAQTPYPYKASTLEQDVFYARQTLAQVLTPAGYALNSDSVQISDGIGAEREQTKENRGPRQFDQLPPEIQNDRYALRVVQFSATHRATGKTFSGWSHLAIVRVPQSDAIGPELNRLARSAINPRSRRKFWSTLVLDIKPYTFALEVRSQDLHLSEGPSNPATSLPSWARSNRTVPAVTSSQILEYLQTRLSDLLRPMGHSLVAGSIDLTETVVVGTGKGYPPTHRLIESADLALRYISFQSIDHKGEIKTGGIELASSRPANAAIQPNDSRRTLLDRNQKPLAELFLSVDVTANSFPLDVRFKNLRLFPEPTISHFRCEDLFRSP